MINIEQEEARAVALREKAAKRCLRLATIEKMLKNMKADRDALGIAVARRMCDEII